MSRIGKRLIKGLKTLLQKLQSGESVEATQVEKVETPDGQMHIRRKVILDDPGTGRKTEDETS